MNAPAAPEIASVALGADRSDRMTVPVRIGESEAMPFVIDTGAERTVISRQLAARLNLEAGPMLNLVTVTGSGQVKTVLVPSLELSGTRVKDIEAPALDQAHIGAQGMLGLDSLQSRRVTLDFKKNEMKVTAARHVEDTDPDTIVVTARRPGCSSFHRWIAASASARCAWSSGKIALRYCVPTSLPWRLSWVGSWVPRNMSRISG